ncbi:E3 ubiquitin-protein ligase mib1 [Bienertia sinuspersici]
MDCESKHSDGVPQIHSLLRLGYGGWLLYTATSAGDVGFVKDLLVRDPLLVAGRGEHGVTDVLYAAARSKKSETFRLLLKSSMSSNKGSKNSEVFVEELMNRAVHAAARGGNLEILKELLLYCSDVLGYRDDQGSTILHSTSGRGQLQVVGDLIATYSGIIDSRYSSVVKVLALASPSLAKSKNNSGDTFLHMAVAGFQSPDFHRIDQQMELIKRLTSGEIINLDDIINIQNDEGKIALHIAVAEDIQCDVLELLMKVPLLNFNICDTDGLTPLYLLKQCRKTTAMNVLSKQLASTD